MTRASVAAERAGIHSVTVVARGFAAQARATAQALGVRRLPLAEYPGVIMTDNDTVFREKVAQSVVQQIIDGLATPVEFVARTTEPAPRDTVFTGTFDEVQEHFHRQMWTDGLPIVPPTTDRVERFLAFTDRDPDDVIAVLPAEQRQATVWNVALNGVMAGCRPEYMPILLAAVEAIADPAFRLQDAGSTPGWEPLIILSGPLITQLDFNSGQGVMRIGRRANSSIGRFLRLYLRNVCGFRIPPGQTDKGTIAGSFNVVLAENETEADRYGWPTFGMDRGFARDENLVTVQSVVSISPPIYAGGDRAVDLLQPIIETWGLGDLASWVGTGMMYGSWFPLLVLSPSLARVIAADGWSKDDVRTYLFEQVRVPARYIERRAWHVGFTSFNIAEQARLGVIPPEFGVSTDPERLVPVFLHPDWIGIVVAGDPDRNQARGFMQNHNQGPPISRPVRLSSRWAELVGSG